MRRFTLALLFLLQVCPVASAFADELRPAYLSIQETRPDEFSVLWKVPALGDKRLGLYLQLPDTCVPKTRAGPLDRERVHIASDGRQSARAV